MKTKEDRLAILQSKFTRSSKSGETPNWTDTGESIVIHRAHGDVQVFDDRFEYCGETIAFKRIRKVIWMGRNRPAVEGARVDARDYKVKYFDCLGFKIGFFRYIEIDDLGQAYAPFLQFVEWTKAYGDL